jgi:hypothetical protein
MDLLIVITSIFQLTTGANVSSVRLDPTAKLTVRAKPRYRRYEAC